MAIILKIHTLHMWLRVARYMEDLLMALSTRLSLIRLNICISQTKTNMPPFRLTWLYIMMTSLTTPLMNVQWMEQPV